MRRFFVKNLLFVLAVNLLVKPVWIFLIDRNVQNRVGHSDYGIYQALFNLGVIFQILLDFGLNAYNTRFISQNPEKLRSYFPPMLTIRLVLILLYGAIVLGIGWFAGYRGQDLMLLGGVLLLQVMSSLMMFIRSNVSALHKFKADGLLSVLDRLLMIVICGALLFYPAFADEFKIGWFVTTQIISYTISLIIGYFVLKRISNVQLGLSWDMSKVKSILRDSAPFALVIFLMAVYTRADMTLVERLLPNGKQQAGVYAAAYRLLDVGNMIGLMLSGMLLPMFGKMLAQKEPVNPIVFLSANLILPVAFMASVAAVFFGSNIMHFLYTNAGPYDGQVFGILMCSFPAFCIMYIYCTLLTANGNLLLLNKIAIVGVIVNIGLNLILIPKYQALGAAITAVVTQTLLASCFILFSIKKTSLNKNLRLVSSHAFFILLLIITCTGISKLAINWMSQLALFGGIGFVLIFIFRFVSLQSVKQLLQKK